MYLPAILLSALLPHLNSESSTAFLAFRLSTWTETSVTGTFSSDKYFVQNSAFSPSALLFCSLKLVSQTPESEKWVHPEPIPIPFLNQCIPACTVISHTWSVYNSFNAISTCLLNDNSIPAILFQRVTKDNGLGLCYENLKLNTASIFLSENLIESILQDCNVTVTMEILHTIHYSVISYS